MRAVIQFTSESGVVNKETIKNILIEDGWNVIDFEDHEFWDNHRNAFIKSNKENFVKAIQPTESKDLEFFYYIHRGVQKNDLEFNLENDQDGIVSRNKQNNYFGIRVFKKKKRMLRESCEQTVAHIIDKIDNPKFPLKFNPVRVYARDGEGELVEAGVIHKNKGSKFRIARRQKYIEFYGGLILLFTAFLITIISYCSRRYDNTIVEHFLNIDEFWLIYVERLIPPLLVSGGLLFYQYYNHYNKAVKLSAIIEWQEE